MYHLRLAFCGTKYHGWQYQENAISVQGVLHSKLEKIFKKECPYPAGCSRTDTAVHALDFIATLPEIVRIPPDALKRGLNSLLPRDIRIIEVTTPEGEFLDGRAFVKGKHYRYLICTSQTASPFAKDLSWHSAYDLDLGKMNQALDYFIGTHDFESFMATGSDVKSTVRTIKKARIKQMDNYLVLDWVGDGFLKHQIRIMSGTLVAVGRGRIEVNDIPEIIAAKDRDKAEQTLPGKGLYLYKLFSTEEEMDSYQFPDIFQDMVW